MNRILDVATSFAATALRGGAGIAVGPLGPRPEKPLELYEFEACPYCRKVREALTVLDLPALVHPCPKGGTRYRPWVEKTGGKAQFPYLVDPNTGKSLYESDAIVEMLFAQYGTGPVPLLLSGGLLNDLSGTLASAVRLGGGVQARPSRQPEQPLELASIEASPFCRIAREALCSLELPYRLLNLGAKSPGRPAFTERAGKMQVPWLRDPNTGQEMFESADIVQYLNDTYAL